MKKLSVKLIVLIPVGPTTSTRFLSDTIESVKFYCDKNHKIILVNDSQKELDKSLLKYDVDEVATDRSMGKRAGLYFSLCKGINFALEHYNFDVILRMDDDALITGLKPENDAIHYFSKNKNIGLLGSYKLAWDGQPRDFGPPRNQILTELSFKWKILRALKRIKANDISSIVQRATKNGYQYGEHVLGGAYFMSPTLARKLSQNSLLPADDFFGSHLDEDHIFAMLAFVVGMKVADFATGDLPMCLKWQGMPASPEEITRLGKKVIHSTRYYGKLNEEQVRKKFRKIRSSHSEHSI